MTPEEPIVSCRQAMEKYHFETVNLLVYELVIIIVPGNYSISTLGSRFGTSCNIYCRPRPSHTGISKPRRQCVKQFDNYKTTFDGDSQENIARAW